MRNAPIVPGVPSPFVMHRHVWPSRFHGPVYTRPVFGFQEGKPGSIIARTQSVLTPGYDLDVNMPQPTLSGLGQTIDTGQGIFKPGGYGGGVFDGDISGLGSIGARTVRPRRRALRGLGDNNAADMPWGQKSAYTTSLQSTINAYLMGQGMCPIAVDGKLGPGTCGAARYVLNAQGDKSNDEMPVSCAGHAMSFTPTKNTGKNCGVAASVTPSGPVVLPSQPALEAGMSSSTKRALGFALGGVLAIGAVVMMRKKR